MAGPTIRVTNATAVLIFFNDVTTTESVSSGPWRIIDRKGTTTTYLNSPPAIFSNPGFFPVGTPVLSATLHQQGIVDTVGGTFTAVFANTISSTSAFTINGATYRFAQQGQSFRQLNPTPPTGYFAGHAAGASGK